MYYGLSGEGTIRKRFLRIRRFHGGRFLFEKHFEEKAFSSEDALKWTVSTVERQLTYPEGSPKTTKLTPRTVAERTILIRRAVVDRTVSILRAVVERAVSIRRAVVERTVPELTYILQVHKRNE